MNIYDEKNIDHTQPEKIQFILTKRSGQIAVNPVKKIYE
ncbi:hypothetical protein PBAL39_02980 [Pedobacter sp. BAL39]|nr:hypothetical protein PBAL39_02980 [Pedobacter sp. BAL39]